ncbi:MAG: hypothetical protein LBI38_00065 [Oscillospiraceae bacterium]|jgi:hypothetical protein|nr:hypothetical protein [Oscillospiraceae bacterium]
MNGGNLVEIAGILSNDNPQAVADAELLAKGFGAFYAEHAEWCGEMGCTVEVPNIIPIIFAYWMSGYGNERDEYGGYYDGRDAMDDVLDGLEPVIKNLGYPLDAGEIEYGGDETITEAMGIINENFNRKGYTLVSLDTDGGCAHLFIVRSADYDRLVGLGEKINFKFSTEWKQ